jgi:hypothetical protein
MAISFFADIINHWLQYFPLPLSISSSIFAMYIYLYFSHLNLGFGQ